MHWRFSEKTRRLRPNRLPPSMRAMLVAAAGFIPSFLSGQQDRPQQILWSVDWAPHHTFFAVAGDWVGLFDGESLTRYPFAPMDGTRGDNVRWHPQHLRVAVSGFAPDTTVIYDLSTGAGIALHTSEGTRGVAWNARGDRLATAGNDGAVQVWSADGQLLRTMRQPDAKSLTGVAWHPRNDTLAAVGEFIILYDESGKIRHEIRHRPQANGPLLLLCVEWHPSGTFFVVGDYGNHDTGEAPALQFWSADGALLKSIEIPVGAAFRNVRWSPDGTRLASASDALRIWSAEGELLHEGRSPDRLWGVGWDPSGRRIVTSSEQGRITLWSSDAQIVQRLIEE